MADMTKMTDSCRTGFDHEEGYFDNRKDANLTQGWLTDAFFFRTKLEWNSINNVKRWWLVAVWDERLHWKPYDASVTEWHNEARRFSKAYEQHLYNERAKEQAARLA